MSSTVPAGNYRFGPFRLDSASRVLDCNGTVVPLAPRTFDLLNAFVTSGGRLLTKHELLRLVWGDVNVEEASLAFQVSTLRKALGEAGTGWIETVPKHGYRFTAPVREVRPEEKPDREAHAIPPAARVRLSPALWRRAAAGLVAIAAALGVYRYASRPDDPIPREARLEAVPFTSYTGSEAEPTFSPDGSLVAFTWDGENQDNFDIYVKAIGAEPPLRLTFDRARDGSPVWSPDGTRIAFLRDRAGGGSEVRLIPPTGGPELAIGQVQGLAHQGLAWSHDGRSLAVVDRSSPEEHLGIFVLDIVSGVKKRLTHTPSSDDILPTFSPDGRTLAFNRTTPGRGPFVHVVPAAGGEPRELVPTTFPRGRLAFIPGGEEILFTALPLAG
ncbi:MAG TPA: winged helix-turn-helix domain-containing protein, partial [Vicinamibacterales bacterium]|nr:winged helix-turn-helix domain-containing protein [Vicinamibacterales bacterium]